MGLSYLLKAILEAAHAFLIFDLISLLVDKIKWLKYLLSQELIKGRFNAL